MGRKTRQNKITSPELIAQINPKNIRLMNDFLEYLRSIGKADSTVKAYTSDLYIFFVWVLQNADNKYFPEISKRDIISVPKLAVAEQRELSRPCAPAEEYVVIFEQLHRSNLG